MGQKRSGIIRPKVFAGLGQIRSSQVRVTSGKVDPDQKKTRVLLIPHTPSKSLKTSLESQKHSPGALILRLKTAASSNSLILLGSGHEYALYSLERNSVEIGQGRLKLQRKCFQIRLGLFRSR